MRDEIEAIEETLANARAHLFAARGPRGYWRGELASSALATAVAAFALRTVDRDVHVKAVAGGTGWLADQVNADGGWGDTPISGSNLSTTLLCWSALRYCAAGREAFARPIAGAEQWVADRLGSAESSRIAESVLRHYGGDRTFSAPILTLCALAGTLGDGEEAWQRVPQLPFELAACPMSVFRWLRLSVVSYAVPALVAIGLVRHRHYPLSSAPRLWLRNKLVPRVLRVLENMQPRGGGFLEAVPLTAFVVMSLAASGLSAHPVAEQGVRFLREAQRADGSWPIDSDLATWVTTLAVNALGPRGTTARDRIPNAAGVRQWLLQQQTGSRNPFTGAAPGGWAWTDLPGGVPDTDDTSGALLALHRLTDDPGTDASAARRGVLWLLELQNGDGGWPTFCKGWGKLPFDRSCPDITAHALCALDVWYDHVELPLQRRINVTMESGISYLEHEQDDDGAWTPLWFGNEQAAGARNPTYGTSRVVTALNRISPERLPSFDHLAEQGAGWLEENQNADGGWGGSLGCASSIEETAVAVEALASCARIRGALAGAAWLCEHTDRGRTFPAAPIGLYFASLWYWEKLYPVVFTVSALETLLRSG